MVFHFDSLTEHHLTWKTRKTPCFRKAVVFQAAAPSTSIINHVAGKNCTRAHYKGIGVFKELLPIASRTDRFLSHLHCQLVTSHQDIKLGHFEEPGIKYFNQVHGWLADSHRWLVSKSIKLQAALPRSKPQTPRSSRGRLLLDSSHQRPGLTEE